MRAEPIMPVRQGTKKAVMITSLTTHVRAPENTRVLLASLWYIRYANKLLITRFTSPDPTPCMPSRYSFSVVCQRLREREEREDREDREERSERREEGERKREGEGREREWIEGEEGEERRERAGE
jgi:hypothetical protein